MTQRPCNLANMRLWIEALESGDFEQAMGTLRTEYVTVDRELRYCCLGVATELAVRNKVVSVVSSEDCWNQAEGHEHTLWCNQPNDETLSEEIARWLGIGVVEDGGEKYSFDADPDLRLSGEYYGDSATGLNDGGSSFKYIAYRLRRLYLPPEEWVPDPDAEEGE